jgi:hypothetical protein
VKTKPDIKQEKSPGFWRGRRKDNLSTREKKL